MEPDLEQVAHDLAREVSGRDAPLEALADLLLEVNRPALLRDVPHARLPFLFESVMASLSPNERKKRGAYYTPPEVVSFLVRSVDALLKNDFPGVTGIAHPHVVALDPACGAGAFLLEAKRLGARSLHGFELMPSAARLAAGLTGAQVVVGNPLDGPALGERWVSGLEHHALLAGGAVPVVIGNPPFRGHSQTSGGRVDARTWIGHLVDLYTMHEPDLRLPGQAKWLQDDYVKFLRFGQWLVERAGTGVIAFVTNHAWLDNPTFRGLRKSLLRTFDHLTVLDLHGNTNRKERVPTEIQARLGLDDDRDDGVFSIRQGTALVTLVRVSRSRHSPRTITHGDLWGRRALKLRALDVALPASPTEWSWTQVTPVPPAHLFVPIDLTLGREYGRLWALPDFFTVGPAPGAVTTHDRFAVAWDEAELEARVAAFLAIEDEPAARERWPLCTQAQWSWDKARASLVDGSWRATVGPLLYRPFDPRVTAWDRHVVVHRRMRLHDHVLGRWNRLLLTVRVVETATPWNHVFVSEQPVQHHTVSTKEVTYAWPLYLYDPDGERRAALSERVLEAIELATGLRWTEGTGDLVHDFGPEDVLAWIYAVLGSGSFRARYEPLLRRGFPRLPLPADRLEIQALAPLGHGLLAAHLGHLGALPADVTASATVGRPGRVAYQDGRLHLDRGGTDDLVVEGVSERDWGFSIGGRRVLEGWLKDRSRDGRLVAVSEILARVGAFRRAQALEDALDPLARRVVERAG